MLDHSLVLPGRGIAIGLERLGFMPFELEDRLAGSQVHVRAGGREVQVLAAIDDRRTGRADMDFTGIALVQQIDGFPHLGAADNRVIAKEQPLFGHQLRNGHQLHPGHEVSHLLVLGHEAARPGRGIFDEWAAKRDAGLIGIADGMPDT